MAKSKAAKKEKAVTREGGAQSGPAPSQGEVAKGGGGGAILSMFFVLARIAIGLIVIFLLYREVTKKTNCKFFDSQVEFMKQPFLLAALGKKSLCKGCKGEVADTSIDGNETLIPRGTAISYYGNRYCFDEHGRVVRESDNQTVGRLRSKTIASFSELIGIIVQFRSDEIKETKES